MSYSRFNYPLVSVVIPTFNRAYCIERAISSVLDQTLSNWELIIVDNNSSDDTLKIIQNFGDERVRTESIENQGIVAKSRNLGIGLAKGKYVAFLDSDDWWTPNKLEVCVRHLEAGSEVVYHNLYQIFQLSERATKSPKVAPARALSKPVFNDLIKNGNALLNSGVIVRRDLIQQIGGFSENKQLVGCEDFDGWLRISRHTDKFERLDVALGYYWSGGGNLSSAQSRVTNCLALSRRYENEINDITGGQLPGWMLYSIARYSLVLGQFREARKHASLVFSSAVATPVKIKALIVMLLAIIKLRM